MDNAGIARNRVTLIGIVTMLITACFTSVLTSNVANELVFETSSADRRRKRKFDDAQRPLMKNLFAFRERPQVPLGPCTVRY